MNNPGWPAWDDNSAVAASLDLDLDPPARFAPVEQRWPLLRAFGPPASALPWPVDGARALEASLRLDLAGRIAARQPWRLLAEELGRAPALALLAAYARRAARARGLLGRARALAEQAAAAGIALVFLKGMALYWLELARPEERPAGDIDALVSEAGAQALESVLLTRGWRRLQVPDYPHQRPPLVDAQGYVLELHLCLPGLVRTDYETLAQQRALFRHAHWPAGVGVPGRELLAAHLLAHGLWQNALAPHVYSPTRLVGDTLALGLLDDPGFVERAAGWLAGPPSRVALAGWLELVRGLAGAREELFDAAACAGPAEPAVSWLRHLLAGAFDERYRRRLRARAALAGPGSGQAGRWRAWRQTLFPPAAQLEALYGVGGGGWGRAWRRARRPADLALRWWRARG